MGTEVNKNGYNHKGYNVNKVYKPNVSRLYAVAGKLKINYQIIKNEENIKINSK